jgi:hypothetical protein
MTAFTWVGVSKAIFAVGTFIAIDVAFDPAQTVDRHHNKVFEHLTCSGTLSKYGAGIADRSIGSGDNMCYFASQSDAGKQILAVCSIGAQCHVTGTVINDQDAGDWSPIIVHAIDVRKQ